VVHRLAGDGWRVVAVDVCADDPSLAYPLATCAELDAVAAKHPDTVLPVVADVRDEPALAAAVRLAVTEFGGWTRGGRAGVMTGGQPLWETLTHSGRAL